MKTTIRESGIESIGAVPWGTHFCQFYRTKDDLLDILVPYFSTGLAHNEFCMWVTAESLTSREAGEALRKAVPDFDARLANGQIEIVSYDDWYLKGGSFDSKRVLNGWIEKLDAALARGFDGMRLTGNTIWLEKKDWASFTAYEEEINGCIGKYRMIALCSYALDRCGATEIIDVVNNHQFALVKQEGRWQIVESSGGKRLEAHYRVIAKNTYDFEYWINPEGRFIYASPSSERVTGRTPGEFLDDPELRRRIVHPDDRAGFDIHVREVEEKRATGEIEHRIRCTDGSVRWVSHACQPVFDGAGRYLGLRGSNRDITERKEAEEELRQTSDYLEKLINYANAPIICWDRRFRITRFNRAFEHLTDRAAGEVIGKELSILFPGESREESLREIRRTLEGEQWEVVEIPILRRDGAVRIVLWNSANVYAEDGRTLIATIAQGQDITERKEAEEELRRTSDYLEKLINYANAPIICWDRRFRITRFNHAFEHLTDRAAGEVIGKELSILFPGESREESLRKIRRTLEGEQWESVEIPILRRDGAVRIALWNSANVYAEDGKTLLATIAQGQDITERKMAEDILKRDKEGVERLVEHRTKELIRVQLALEKAKRLSDIGTLAATVAHELRNPLAAMSMAAANIKRKAKDPSIEKNLRTIDKKVAESDQIIDNLLFYSRIKSPHRETVDLGGILEECVDSMQARFHRSGAEVVKGWGPLARVPVSADPLQMKELFNNLMCNAYEAIPDEGGRIEIAGVSDNGHAVVRVADNGGGIDEKILHRVFDPFYTTKAKGTGLGLSVCNQIVSLHGGTLRIECTSRHGTTVAVSLPLKGERNA